MLTARSPTRSRSVLILTADDDRAQVDRHRLVERQQLEAAVVDLDVQLVDGRVAAEHALDQSRVALDQPAHGQPHAVLGQAAHFEQAGLELFELFLKVRDVTLLSHGGYPNRPVT